MGPTQASVRPSCASCSSMLKKALTLVSFFGCGSAALCSERWPEDTEVRTPGLLRVFVPTLNILNVPSLPDGRGS